MKIPTFDHEGDFKNWYLQLSSAEEQITALQEWRRRQMQMVGALDSLVRLLASEQYTQIDHFLLELLQNADDNTFRERAVPELKIILTDESCTFECNEQGFTPENVFSISYAAASTKHRERNARTFIGEKGIGFKSIFGVATAVDIHSGDFHFQLRDNEFIIPHWLGGASEPGSRIVIHFKPSLTGIANTLSQRLQTLADQAQQFVLFLQQLEMLTIDDRVVQRQRTVEILRDEKAQRYLVNVEGKSTFYHVESFALKFPDGLVRSRFDNLSGDLVRDVIIALPLADDLPEKPEQGRLFCYLPTAVSTGFPFHIQIDAKTTTNRENIENSAKSAWNGAVLNALPRILVRLFTRLRDHPDFSRHLPRYLANPSELALGNDEVVAAVRQTIEYLKSTDIAVSRNGQFTAPSAIKFTTNEISRWIETEQYEPYLPAFFRTTSQSTGNVTESVAGAFLHRDWRQHAAILKSYGCEELTTLKIAEILQKGGRPGLLGSDENSAREFLSAVMQLQLPQFSRDAHVEALRRAPIFPISTGKTQSWGPIDSKTMVISTESRQVGAPPGVSVIDPRYTFSPGGSAPEALRLFNDRYRTYLTDILKVRRYSEVEYLDTIVLAEMQAPPVSEVLNRAQHFQLADKWVNLYYRIWRRKNTIIDDSSEQRWQQLLQKIGKCYISVTSNDPKKIKTIQLELAFLTEQLGGLSGFEEAYRATEAPFVNLPLDAALKSYFSRRQRRRHHTIDWLDWGQFFLQCCAKPGPYLIDISLQKFQGEYKNVWGSEAFWQNALLSIRERSSYNFRVVELSTSGFEKFTSQLIQDEGTPEVVTRGASRCWDRLAKSTSSFGYLYHQRRVTQYHYPQGSLGKIQVGPHLRVLSDRGCLPPSECFLRTPENETLISGILPLVDPSRYEGNIDFLTSIGVRPALSVEILERLVRDRADLTSIAGTADDFIPYLRVAAKLGQRGARERNWIRTASIFYHLEERQLLDYLEWSKRGGDYSYPEDIRITLASLFTTITYASHPDLFQDLANLGDLMPNEHEVIKWILRAADHLTRENGDALGSAFAIFMREHGVTVAGTKANLLTQLPLAWDATPPPLATASILLLPAAPIDRARCEIALRALGWPLLSECGVGVAYDERISPVPSLFLQLKLTLEHVFDSFESTNFSDAARMRQSRLGRNKEQLEKIIVPCKGLALNITRDGHVVGEYDVPFWWQGPIVFIDVLRTTIPLGVASVLDTECGVTTTPFFEPIFLGKEAVAKESEGTHTSSPKPDAGFSGSGTTRSSGSSQRDRPRKRLYSYVLPVLDNRVTGPDAREEATKRRAETEQAAVKLFKDFFHGSGLSCRSVEDQDLGYDFEVNLGDRILCIEVKGSGDHWRNWEHDLTPNEFRAAQEKGDDYILCLVERVFNDDWEICFVQNPFAHIDGFLFDSPWKQLAVHGKTFFSHFRPLEDF